MGKKKKGPPVHFLRLRLKITDRSDNNEQETSSRRLMAAEGTEISLLFLIRTLEGSHFNNLQHSYKQISFKWHFIGIVQDFMCSHAVSVQNILSGKNC